MKKLTKEKTEQRRLATFYYNIIQNYLKKSKLDAYVQPLNGPFYKYCDHQQCVRFDTAAAEDINRFMKWLRKRTANQVSLKHKNYDSRDYDRHQAIEITY